MKRSVLAFVLLAVPTFAQTSAPSPAPDQSAAARAAAGCGPSTIVYEVKTDKHQHPTAQPEAGKALVYVIADVSYSPVTKVGVDGDWVGANRRESYFFFPVAPGEHRLCINWQSSRKLFLKVGSALTFTAEAGKTYYFRAANDEKKEHELSVALEAVDPAKAQFLISSAAFSTSHPKK